MIIPNIYMERQRIFISSVQSEFRHERKQLAEYIRTDALLGKFFVPFIFEELPAINLSAQEAYLHEAEHCDIYLGILRQDSKNRLSSKRRTSKQPFGVDLSPKMSLNSMCETRRKTVMSRF